MSNLLQMVQDVASRRNLTKPRSVVNSTDPTSEKFLALLHKELQKLRKRYAWEELIREHVITYVEGQDQYALPVDFDRPLPDTSYDRSRRWLRHGSTVEAEQRFQSSYITYTHTPRILMKGVSNNRVHVYPTPTASQVGETGVFNYISKNVVQPKLWDPSKKFQTNEMGRNNGVYYKALSAGITNIIPTHTSGIVLYNSVPVQVVTNSQVFERFTSDTDEPVLDSMLIEMAIEYLFLMSSGFQYQDAEAEYYAHLATLINAQTPTQTIYPRQYTKEYDLINIPEGGWYS